MRRTPPPRTPSAQPSAAAAAAAGSGTSSARRSLRRSAVPHGSAGPTPTRSSSERNNGTAIRLKYGAPTLTLMPRTDSAKTGWSVPISTVNMSATSSRLLMKNAPSRAISVSLTRRPGELVDAQA